LRRVVAIRQAVEHSNGALGSAVAWIGTIGGERNRPERSQFFGSGLNEQANLPMPGMITEGNWAAIGRADAALRADD
jgi:hypothetical protein